MLIKLDSVKYAVTLSQSPFNFFLFSSVLIPRNELRKEDQLFSQLRVH